MVVITRHPTMYNGDAVLLHHTTAAPRTIYNYKYDMLIHQIQQSTSFYTILTDTTIKNIIHIIYITNKRQELKLHHVKYLSVMIE